MQVKYENMKERILDVAAQQLLRGGYERLNFGKIADELGTTRANLHYHFKNKENLALEVFKGYEIEKTALYSKFRDQSKGNYVNFFREIEDFLWAPISQNKERGRVVIIEIISDASLPQEIAKMCQELFEKLGEIIKSVIQDGVDSGKIKKKIDVDKEAVRAHTLMVGVFTAEHYYQCDADAKEKLGSILLEWADSLKKSD